MALTNSGDSGISVSAVREAAALVQEPLWEKTLMT